MWIEKGDSSKKEPTIKLFGYHVNDLNFPHSDKLLIPLINDSLNWLGLHALVC